MSPGLKIEGNIFNIERHALHDGPGIRTLVFLSGCSLACKWCSNPECAAPKVLYVWANQCTHCGMCVRHCPQHAIKMEGGKVKTDRSLCTVCGVCTDFCPQGAREIAGERMTVEEVLEIVKRDMPFYVNSGGGLTVSGGEPFVQQEFAYALLKQAKALGMHTAVETCGAVPWEAIEPALPYINLFLYDIKHVNREKHRQYTGMEPDLILENIRKLSDAGAQLTVRIPVIPGFNDKAEEIGEIVRFAAGLSGVKRIDLLPFHKLAISKHEALGSRYPMEGAEVLPAEQVDRLEKEAKKYFENIHIEV